MAKKGGMGKSPGGQGGFALRSGLAMIEQALTQGWDIPDEAFASVPLEVMLIAVNKVRRDGEVVEGSYTTRERLRAAAVLARLKDSDVHRAAVVLSREGQRLHVTLDGHVGIRDVRRELLNDRDYLAYKREGAIRRNVDAGSSGGNGNGRPVENGPASSSD